MESELKELEQEIKELKKRYLLSLDDSVDEEIKKIKEELLSPIIKSSNGKYSDKTVRDAKEAKEKIFTVNSDVSATVITVASSMLEFELSATGVVADTLEKTMENFSNYLDSVNDRILGNMPGKSEDDLEASLDDISQSYDLNSIRVSRSIARVLETSLRAKELHTQLIREFSGEKLSKPISQVFEDLVKGAGTDAKDETEKALWKEFLKIVQEMITIVIEEESPIHKFPRYVKKLRNALGERELDLSAGGAAELINILISYLEKIELLINKLKEIADRNSQLNHEILAGEST
ncbi:MAG: hypothetical protein HRT55_19395 [Colwellia sp.]|uniref:hypothetical protein n=1 Tax=Alteromonadales TaxID=135622 RepID=UPI001D6CE526|nr:MULTISPECIES: hypothetical protein [Alteromonadales]NQZ28471.1 hypothetical protein [Colwellia sp.]NRA81199.1 hypothetical protein [Pseudoalteromonas sp.]